MKEYQYESFYGERALFNSKGLKIINSSFIDWNQHYLDYFRENDVQKRQVAF